MTDATADIVLGLAPRSASAGRWRWFGGVAASIVLHLGAVALAVYGVGFIQPLEAPGVASISVDLVGEAEFTLLQPDEPEVVRVEPSPPGEVEVEEQSVVTEQLPVLPVTPIVVPAPQPVEVEAPEPGPEPTAEVVPVEPEPPAKSSPTLPEGTEPVPPEPVAAEPIQVVEPVPEVVEPAVVAPQPAVQTAAIDRKRQEFAAAREAQRRQGDVAASSVGKSLGVWQTTDRNMDYEVELCGDGRQLCGKLVGIRGAADIPARRAYLDKPLVENLQLVGPNTWQGAVNIEGYSASGTVTINPGQSIVINACVYLVICQQATLIPKL